MILLMSAKNAGKTLAAIEGNPGELSAVVVQEAGREANAPACGDVGQRCVVIGAVEICDFSRFH